MFTQDYLLRMINQALAALLTAIGLRKAGRGEEALQAIDQAVEGLTSLSPSLLDQLDEQGLLSLLLGQGAPDPARLAVLADLYHEQGEILTELGQPAAGTESVRRALRLLLEAVRSGEGVLFPELIGKIEARRKALAAEELPEGTERALVDYLRRLAAVPEGDLAAGGVSRSQILAELESHQAMLGPGPEPTQG